MKIKLALDPQILRNYAIATTSLFAGLGIYYFIGLKAQGASESVHLMTVQAFGMTMFVLVLISALVGMAFHQLVSTEAKARNTFAFVFGISVLKFAFSLLVFDAFL